jgi:membrane-bound ClpP family serine protease
MVDVLFWAGILVIVGIGLFVLELFVPSGGVLSVLAVLAIAGSVIVAFTGGVLPGMIALVGNLILIPLLIVAAVKWWPYTPIGRMVVLHVPESDDEILPNTPVYRELRDLVGRRGNAKTKMLPSGAVVIDGRTYDAVSDGVAIEPGQPIRVKAVRTNRIIVVPVSSNLSASMAENDVLAQPAEDFGLGSLEDPNV